MSRDQLPPETAGSDEDGYEYEYEYVEVEEGAELDGADGDVEYEYEYVEETDGSPVGDDVEYVEEVVYEEIEGDAELAADGEYEVEYEYVTTDEDGNVLETETAATPSQPVNTVVASVRTSAASAPRKEVVYEDVTTGTREIPAWLTSFVVHFGVLGVLGLMSFSIPVEEKIPPVQSIVEELTPEDYKFDETIVDTIGADSEVNKVSPSQQSATQLGQNPQEALQEMLEESFTLDETPPPIQMMEPHSSDFVSQANLNGATEHVGGTEGALDRLAMEIGSSLKENKTMVVWLFDGSASLTKQRGQIADRFQNVYKQVGILDVETDEKALKTAVMSYGQGVNFLTKEPVDHADEVADAVRNIPVDNSGKEHVFTAVNMALTKYRSYRTAMRRNLMFVIVTDERGDDYMQIEETIAACRRLGVKVYVVGPSTIFGQEENYVMWTYEDGYTEELPVDGGPETLEPQRLKLGFWGGNDRDLARMSSGFGPYALTRLAVETGGLYLVNKDTTGPKFSSDVMKDYLPDYRSIPEYLKAKEQNAAKKWLVEAAKSTQAEQVFFPRRSFSADNDNILRQQITEAQKPAAVFEVRINKMLMMLEQGESDRDNLDSPRWKAAYDLALGRALAMRARAYGYNVVLANMKASPLPFEKEGSNSWRLESSKEIGGGASVRKLVKRATEYLSRVIDEHPNTPWAMLAERELSIPMGWEWQEFSVSRAAGGMRGPGNAGNNVQLADDEERERRMMQQMKKERKRPNL